MKKHEQIAFHLSDYIHDQLNFNITYTLDVDFGNKLIKLLYGELNEQLCHRLSYELWDHIADIKNEKT